MGSDRRKNRVLVLVLHVAYLVCAVSAATFDKGTGKSSVGDHHHQQEQGLQLSRDPVEQQHQQQQDLLAAMEGQYQLPSSLEDELEQRLLLSSLLENGPRNHQHNNMDNRLYYNSDAPEDYEPEEPYPQLMEEKRSSPSNSFLVFRRGCIRRSMNCDHRPNDCCYSSSCRCNLWGSNCRCQRMGLFQKWG